MAACCAWWAPSAPISSASSPSRPARCASHHTAPLLLPVSKCSVLFGGIIRSLSAVRKGPPKRRPLRLAKGLSVRDSSQRQDLADCTRHISAGRYTLLTPFVDCETAPLQRFGCEAPSASVIVELRVRYGGCYIEYRRCFD